MKSSATLLSASLSLALCVSPLLAGRAVAARQKTGGAAGPRASVTGLRKINESRMGATAGWYMSVVFDGRYAYLGTPNGLYRTTRWIAPERPFGQFKFAGREITNLYVYKDELYVLKRAEMSQGGPAADHSFLKSSDGGESFVPLDEGLSECFGGYCGYLTATQAVFKDDLIFLTAGGGLNLFVSPSGGRGWTTLSGSVNSQACYEPAFELVGRRVLMGGECPLDMAYLRAAALREDYLGWQDSGQVFKPVAVEDLGNRNVQFVRRRPGTATVFAGVEGGLLKSDDGGQSFRFVIKQPASGAGNYPYVRSIVFPSASADLVLVSGFDKAVSKGYLAYSKDGGETWTDISGLVRTPEFDAYNVPLVTEDPEGRIIAAVVRRLDAATWGVVTAEVLLDTPAPAPALLTEEGAARAVALDSVTLRRGPFSLTNAHNFSPDGRTRVTIFARNVRLLAGEGASAVTARAEDAAHKVYDLPVEYAGPVQNFEWLTQIVVRLPDALDGAGEVQVSVGYHGTTSNKALLNVAASESSPP